MDGQLILDVLQFRDTSTDHVDARAVTIVCALQPFDNGWRNERRRPCVSLLELRPRGSLVREFLG